LAPFWAEAFVLHFAIQKYKPYNTQNYNFVRRCVRVWNLHSYKIGGTQAEEVGKWVIWT